MFTRSHNIEICTWTAVSGGGPAGKVNGLYYHIPRDYKDKVYQSPDLICNRRKHNPKHGKMANRISDFTQSRIELNQGCQNIVITGIIGLWLPNSVVIDIRTLHTLRFTTHEALISVETS